MDQLHKSHTWIFTVGSWLVYGGIASIVTFCGLKDIPNDIKDIKKNVSVLNGNLKNTTNGGIPIVVGVNSKELKENIAYVFSENKHELEPGERVYLTNFTDNTYQATIVVVVQKKISKPNNDTSAADLFISEDAAARLGFKDYKKTGIIELKFQRINPEKKSSSKFE
ncbi:hypothetical protein [Limnohabitans sp.]|uniref:hypothetical protein n=1 Tax=Limnohabitans sp. TaxID=1907725 RepID=UPI0035B36BC1